MVRIVDEKGKAIAGVRVTVLSQNLPHSVNYPIPPDWLGRMSGVTDADGRVRIASAVPEALAEVILQPPGGVPRVRLSRDFFLNHRPDKSTPQFTWAWPAKGNIKGRIEVQGGKLPANLKISITTESKLPNSIALVGTYGEATAAVDAEGRFDGRWHSGGAHHHCAVPGRSAAAPRRDSLGRQGRSGQNKLAYDPRPARRAGARSDSQARYASKDIHSSLFG